jgi:2-methylaconitate cis-trans-isomerase PrpF
MVPRPNGVDATVRIHNTNTRKIIVSRFGMDGGCAAVAGDLALDGVAGTGAPIRLDFADPAGARTGRLLPSGHATDTLELAELGHIEASMIDAANPCVFVRASDLGRSATERPDALERDATLLEKLEAIRRAASVTMGIAPNLEAAGAIPGVPKVAMVAAPAETRTLSGRVLTANDTDVLVRMISVGQPHRAVPLTGALCLAVACRVPGSIPQQLAGTAPEGNLRIGHASGVVLVAADARVTANGIEVPYATVYRTARRLFQGEVFYPALERRQAT